MSRLNENMTRKHNWDQLQIIQNKIDKEGGDISSKLGKDYKNQSKTNNSMSIDNPLKRKIDLSDDEKNANTHTDSQLKNLPKNSLITKFESFYSEQDSEQDTEKEFRNKIYSKAKYDDNLRYTITESEEEDDKLLLSEIDKLNISDIKKLLNENKNNDTNMDKNTNEPTDRGNVDKIHREMKTIRNWDNYFSDAVGGNPNPKKERNVLAGRQVELGDGKVGYIESVEGNDVIVQTLDGSGHKKMKISEITKNYKVEKPTQKSEKVIDMTLSGPKQTNKSEIVDTDYKAKDLTEKSEETKDSKEISKDIYSEKTIKVKKLQDFGDTTF